MQLYNLADQYNTLLDLIEDDDAFDQAVKDLKDELTDKCVAVAKVIRSLEAQAKVFSDEAERLQYHAKARQNTATRLKDYLKETMTETGIDHIQGDVIDIRLQKSPPSVEVPNEAVVGDHWKRASLNLPMVEVPEELRGQAVVSIDRRGILEWVKNGNEAPDGVTITQSKHIRLR